MHIICRRGTLSTTTCITTSWARVQTPTCLSETLTTYAFLRLYISVCIYI